MKKVILSALMILLTGCFLGYDHVGFTDVYMVNTFFKDLYVDPQIEKIINLHMLDIDYIDRVDYNDKFSMYVLDFKNTKVTKRFYQDKEKTCYLFPVTNTELLDMLRLFRQSHKKETPIFLIEKDGIKAVTLDEYMQIKPTLRPHMFDKALCKPIPIIE